MPTHTSDPDASLGGTNKAVDWMMTYQQVVGPHLTGALQSGLTQLHYVFIAEITPVLRPRLVFKGPETCRQTH